MLDPRERTVLLEALRPPEGAELDAAIGTTFSLDLSALLTAPLAFTVFDQEGADGRLTADPLVLLESLRQFAERITIFCQAGRIAVPKQHRPLFGYLERSVVEVAAPREGGVFHPKVWLLRFRAAEGEALYRFLCLSRNLTFDSSWDTVLVLDGRLEAERKNAFNANHPLGDFIRDLPSMAVRPVADDVRSRVAQMQDEVRRVRFTAPPWADELQFRPLGIRGYQKWPFPENERPMMVVSPFVSAGALKRLAEGRKGCVLVSRDVALEGVPPEVLARFDRVCFLSDDTEPEEVAEESADDGDAAGEETLRGLHAKLYVMDDGWHARLWTGSANATEAAFARNVEFLVELAGVKSDCGIAAALGAGDPSLEHLLVPFEPGDDGAPASEEERLRAVAEKVRAALATAPLTLRAQRADDEKESYQLELVTNEAARHVVPEGCAVRCRPIALGEGRWVSMRGAGKVLAQFEKVSWQAVGPFVAFEVTAGFGNGLGEDRGSCSRCRWRADLPTGMKDFWRRCSLIASRYCVSCCCSWPKGARSSRRFKPRS